MGPRARIVQVLLHLAGGWSYFGQSERARPILDEARDLLLQTPALLSNLEQTTLTCGYAQALGQVPVDVATGRYLELFRKLDGVYDVQTTGTHYSFTKLCFVESVILAMVSDDFMVDQEMRRWLDDDEYLIRRRIHRDVRELV
jgi:hypothetical protein